MTMTPQRTGARALLDEKSMHVIKHTLGLDHEKIPYRNYFSADEEHAEYGILEALVQQGLMTKRVNPYDEMSKSFIYSVTELGKSLVTE